MKTRFQKHELWISIACLAAVIFLLSSCAGWKPDPWTPQDIVAEGFYQALTFVDYGQTQDIADKPGSHRETNPFMSDHPSPQEVRWMIGGAMVGHAVVAWILPTDFYGWNLRHGWQYIFIGIEGYTTWRNDSVSGLGWRF